MLKQAALSREKLQGPRRNKDSFYGRHVMRRISIYITATLVPFSVSPFWVNFASIVSGLAGAWFLSQGQWFLGIIFVNGWYLLDHVDGEVARAQGITCASGLFFDTIANAIVPPFTFLGLGVGLGWVAAGFTAFYGSLMLSVIPFCESMVILQRVRQGRIRITAPDTYGQKSQENKAASRPFLKKFFSIWHETVTFPVFLPVLTLGIFLFQERLLEPLLIYYAASSTAVWILIIAHAVVTQKIDRFYPEVRP
ncbi:MAG: CDP-alcohol phosphatidyltransferase family protein [Candidatus Omnitrophica bacterium]|nr:CDP-alcohol phosphatidyltransferase family protein [Candidatus Omnitrophota bacterium]